MMNFNTDLSHPRLRELLEKFHPEHNEFNLATLLLWTHQTQYGWLESNDRLWLYAAAADFLCYPMGEDVPASELKQMSDQLRSSGKSGSIHLAPSAEIAAKHEELSPFFTVETDRDNFEYIYDTASLVELRGGLLQKKKNLINQFTSANPDYVARPLRPADREICQKIHREWCVVRKCTEKNENNECRALKKGFELWEQLGLKGQLLIAGGTPIAFSIYVKQDQKMATVLFEWGLLDTKGAAQMINWITAKTIQADGFVLINREQDLGLPGLRQAKLSYKPKYLYEVSNLIPLVEPS